MLEFFSAVLPTPLPYHDNDKLDIGNGQLLEMENKFYYLI